MGLARGRIVVLLGTASVLLACQGPPATLDGARAAEKLPNFVEGWAKTEWEATLPPCADTVEIQVGERFLIFDSRGYDVGVQLGVTVCRGDEPSVIARTVDLQRAFRRTHVETFQSRGPLCRLALADTASAEARVEYTRTHRDRMLRALNAVWPGERMRIRAYGCEEFDLHSTVVRMIP